MSRDAPPPLPGGYKVGDKVFYTGAGYTFANGDKVVHGQQGEVVGPATSETHKGKGVAVLFPGNNTHVNCYLTTVRRLRATPAATRPRMRPTRRCMRTPRAGRPPSTRPQLQATAAAAALERATPRTSPLCLLVNARR